MCEVVKVSTVKTRKDHKCFGCNRNFPASCELERQVIRNEHELYSIYLCPTCQIISRSNLSDDEEYYQGDFYDLAIEFENNPK